MTLKIVKRQRSKKKHLLEAYLYAKQSVINEGYLDEIDWQESISYADVDESYFLREAAWVILSSGMREKVIRNLFPTISHTFFNWQSSEKIIDNQNICRETALSIFNSPPKIDAIIYIANSIYRESFLVVYNSVYEMGTSYIMKFPFMGPATSLHFAKNLGLSVAKPDRHLKRIAREFGYNSPDKLCSEIAEMLGEKISVVDLVFWRFATLNTNYLYKLQKRS